MQFLDLLSACHDASSTSKSDVPPYYIEVLMINCANVASLTRESCQNIAAKLVILICHDIDEASDDCFGDIYIRSVQKEITRLLGSPLFFGCVVTWVRTVGDGEEGKGDGGWAWVRSFTWGWCWHTQVARRDG